MLEIDHSRKITELLAVLPCAVRIPAEWGDYLSREGVLPALGNDPRRLARKRFRTKAALEIKTSLPAITREASVMAVYTRDISRTSISFLASLQIYPGEVFRLWLTDRRLHVTAVRCSRVNSECYIVGCTFE